MEDERRWVAGMQWDGEDGREGEREQNIRSPNGKLNRECLNMKYQTEICYLNIVWLFLGKRKEDLKKTKLYG